MDRNRLLAMSGRGRKPQMELAERMGIRDYPAPAGGCLLTDPEMANRIRKMFSRSSEVTVSGVLLLQVGRHFQLCEDQHLVVGRTEEENERLLSLCRDGDVLLKLKGIPGPLALLRGRVEDAGLRAAASIVARYSKARTKETAEVEIEKKPGSGGTCVTVAPAREEEVLSLKF